jgi:hypothetical protein
VTRLSNAKMVDKSRDLSSIVNTKVNSGTRSKRVRHKFLEKHGSNSKIVLRGSKDNYLMSITSEPGIPGI